MPPLTIEALVASNRNVRKQKTESNEQYLARLTHVSVTGQNITKLVRMLCVFVLGDERAGGCAPERGSIRRTAPAICTGFGRGSAAGSVAVYSFLFFCF
jgi:hypothetical protein